jgi:taurine dioxygenase
VAFAPRDLDTGVLGSTAIRARVRDVGLALVRDLELDVEGFVRVVQSLGPIVCPWDSTKVLPTDARVQDMTVQAGGYEKDRVSSAEHWHSDQSFAARPTGFTALYCIEGTRVGGGTQLCSTRISALSPGYLSALPDGAWIRHSFSESLGVMLQGRRHPEDLKKVTEKYPDVWHPLVRTQPGTGAAALFLSPLTARTIRTGRQEADVSSSRAFGTLIRGATRRGNVYTHLWRAGDLLLWDNSVVMHRRQPGPVEGSRINWRAVTRGQRVTAASGDWS